MYPSPAPLATKNDTVTYSSSALLHLASDSYRLLTAALRQRVGRGA